VLEGGLVPHVPARPAFLSVKTMAFASLQTSVCVQVTSSNSRFLLTFIQVNSGFEGPICTDYVCTPACTHGGVCNSSHQCNCSNATSGYFGDTCSSFTCSQSCQNGGTCTAPNTCNCDGTGYSGSVCETANFIQTETPGTPPSADNTSVIAGAS